MRRIDIKVTFQCNNRCQFCVQGEKRTLFKDKETKEIKTILTESKSNYDEVVFSGGESTLRKDIIELLTHAKKLGFVIQLQTNGRMFKYKGFCRDIMHAGCYVFAVSIHGHNARLHDKLTGVKGSLAQSSSGIRNLLSLGAVVVTNTVINKLNYKFLPKIADFVINLGISQYQLSFPHILGSALINISSIVPRKKDVMPYVIKAIEVGLKRGKQPKVEAIPFCFLKNFSFCLTDNQIPETKAFDAQVTEDFNLWRKQEGKSKGPRCKECRCFESCEGPWREYPQFFGWDEFVPVK